MEDYSESDGLIDHLRSWDVNAKELLDKSR
jgi:hypothetical protein